MAALVSAISTSARCPDEPGDDDSADGLTVVAPLVGSGKTA
jgi:hypothetical protein